MEIARASYRISCLRARQRAGQRRQNVDAPDSTRFVVPSLFRSNNGFGVPMPAAAERCEHLCVHARALFHFDQRIILSHSFLPPCKLLNPTTFEDALSRMG